MKLPKITNQVVQTVGRHKTGAITQLASAVGAKGQANQKAFSLLAEVGQDFINRKQDAEYNDAIASMQVNMNEFQAQHGSKQFYTSSELGDISEDLVPRTVKGFEDGIETTTFRTDIPAYEVYPHLLQQQLEGQIKVTADKISNPRMRNEFMNKADVNASTLMMNAMLNAETAQKKYQSALTVERATDAAKAKDWAMVEFQIEQWEATELEKKQLSDDLKPIMEYAFVTDSIRSNNPDVVMEALSQYRDPSVDTDLTEPMRQATVRDLSNRLKELTVGWGDAAELAADRAYSDFVMGIRAGTVTPEIIEERYNRPPGADGALTVDQRDESHAVWRAKQSADDVIRRRLESAAKAKKAADLVLRNKEEKKINSVYFNKVLEAVDNRQFNYTDLEESYAQHEKSWKAGAIDPNTIDEKQYTQIRERLIQRDAKTDQASINLARGVDMIENGGTANRDLKLDQNGVDAYVEYYQITDPQRLAEIAAMTSIMPQVTENILTHGALNQNAESAQLALVTFGALKDTASKSLNDLGSDTQNLLADAWQQHSLGDDPIEAFKNANLNQQVTDVQRDQRNFEYSSEKYAQGNTNDLKIRMSGDDSGQYRFDPGFFSMSLKPPQEMIGEFQELVRSGHMRHGNIELARSQAWDRIGQTWAPSAVANFMHGDELVQENEATKYGVEHTLNIDTDTAQWRVNAFAESYTLDPETVILRWDNHTARDGHTWPVWVYDPETNFPMPVIDEFGQILRFDGLQWAEQGKELKYRTEAANEVENDKRLSDAAAANALSM